MHVQMTIFHIRFMIPPDLLSIVFFLLSIAVQATAFVWQRAIVLFSQFNVYIIYVTMQYSYGGRRLGSKNVR